MKDKGFTLIELLAVIVILAIIAIIAVPMVLNIINDAKESANVRTVENYMIAAKNAAVKNQIDYPNIAIEGIYDIQSDGNLICQSTSTCAGISLTVTVDGTTLNSGTITFKEDDSNYKVIGKNLHIKNTDNDLKYKYESGTAEINNAKNFSITYNLKNIEMSSTEISSIEENSSIILEFSISNSNYKIPETISTIDGATLQWTKINDEKGKLIISNPTKNLNITINGEFKKTQYTYDIINSSYYIYEGNWQSATGVYYYSIIPLTVGKYYTLTMVSTNGVKRFRNCLSDTNEIGSSTLTKVGDTDSPKNGQTITFKATQPYLISYSSNLNGAVIELDEYDGVKDLTNTKWQLNETINEMPLVNKVFVLNATCQSGNYSVTLPYTYRGYTYEQLTLGNSSSYSMFSFATYGGGSSCYGKFFRYYGTGGSGQAWYYNTYDNNGSTDGDKAVDPPTLTITGGESATDFSLINWLNANANLITE